MEKLYFIIPPKADENKLVTGSVAERVAEGVHLCFFGGAIVVGRLIGVDAMQQQNWHFFAEPRQLNQAIQQYQQAFQEQQAANEKAAQAASKPRRVRAPRQPRLNLPEANAGQS